MNKLGEHDPRFLSTNDLQASEHKSARSIWCRFQEEEEKTRTTNHTNEKKPNVQHQCRRSIWFYWSWGFDK